MNYYAARKRSTDGRYDYTCMNDNRIWPIGYCRPIKPFDVDFNEKLFGKDSIEQLKKEYEEDLAKFGKHYHANGHETEEEACNCYRRYVLDHNVKMWVKPLDEDRRDMHRKCGHGLQGETEFKCGNWTMNLCEVGPFWYVYLCDEHLKQETLEQIYPKVSCSTSSY